VRREPTNKVEDGIANRSENPVDELSSGNWAMYSQRRADPVNSASRHGGINAYFSPSYQV
jgi:hypothetical protein